MKESKKKPPIETLNIPVTDMENNENSFIIRPKIATVDGVILFDVDGTTIKHVDPFKSSAPKKSIIVYKDDENLSSKEERILYSLECPGAYTQENVEKLKQTAKLLGLEDVYNFHCARLREKGIPDRNIFYIVADIMATEYCIKIGDPNEEKRTALVTKMCALADPALFEKVVNYAKDKYDAEVALAILTGANPSRRQAYEQMFGRYGLDVFITPDPELNGYFKDDIRLYHLLSHKLEKNPDEMGLVDDSKKYVDAARAAGVHGVQHDESKRSVFDTSVMATDELFGPRA